MTFFPQLAFGAPLAAAQPVASVDLYENQLAADPRIWGWYRAPDYDAATGIWADHRWRERSGFARAMRQATAARRPAVTANWLATGKPAVTFDGVDDQLVCDKPPPNGLASYVAIFSVPAASGSVTRTIFGGADAASNSTFFGVNHSSGQHKPRLYAGTSGATSANPVIPINTKTLMIGCFDSIGQVFATRVNGGAWQTAALSRSNIVSETVLKMGVNNSDDDGVFTGSVAEGMSVGISLYSGRHADLLGRIEAWAAASYGIVLG